MKLEFTRVFKDNWDALHNDDINFICNIGTSRSSKTWSIIQLLIIKCMQQKMRVCIVRESLAVLRDSIIPDIDEIIDMMNLSNVIIKNGKPSYVFPNGSVIVFVGTEKINRLKGIKRDLLYINEATNISKEAAMQIFMRTTSKTIIDMNPDVDIDEHWIGKYLKKDSSLIIRSSWKNNPFLTDENIENIEMMCEVDENYYRVYALGLPAIPRNNVYSNWKEFNIKDLREKPIRIVYGIDQGYNHPSTVIKTYIFNNNTIYVEELLCLSNLSSIELVHKIVEILDKDNYEYEEVYVDSAVPELIKDLKKYNINAKSAIKDVIQGINYIRSCRIYVEENSVNLWKEYKMYKVKSNSSNFLFEEPIKLYDDCCDAMRYAIYSDYIKNKKGNYSYMSI